MPKVKFTTKFIQSIKSEKQTDYYDLHTSGLGLRVSPGGSKTFFYRYRANGKNRRYTINRFSKVYSLAQARTRADELRSYTKKGGDPYIEEKTKKNVTKKTFGEVISSYKEKHVSQLKESTQLDYKRRIKHLISGDGANKKTKSRGFDPERYIKDIKRSEVIDYLHEIAKSSPTQAKRLQAILSGIFKFAKDREWVDFNIAREITLKKRVAKDNKWQNRPFNDQELKILWKEFDNHNEPIGSLFKMLTILGQRSGETRLMKWQDLNLKERYWFITSPDTKNKNSTYVPLPDKAIEILTALKNRKLNKTYVFPSPVKKDKPIYGLQKAASRIGEKTSVNDFNAHSLRTTVTTRLAELNISPQVLSKVLNHKNGTGNSVTALYNRYDYKKEKRAALNKWCGKLSDIINKEDQEITTA
ncbi:tyrosine-type recombinase/integrase [Rhodohalobacter sp. 8-1]|uniref:tyrosine-type recombinase/integrase n=1 Tax=Rhodohalobacter sp. 8-1 TaxID=3131972 RepID=UPI0030EB145B